MSFLLIALLVAAVMVGVYLLVHKIAPTWGSIGAATGLGLSSVGLYLDQALALANQLPWASIMTPQRSAAVLFGVASAMAAMKLIRAAREKKAD